MAGDASRENGKKGGRPKGYAALQAEKQREYVAKQLEIHWAPIVKKTIELAENGDKAAREWLADQAFGKPKQAIDLSDPDGTLKQIVILKDGGNSNHTTTA